MCQHFILFSRPLFFSLQKPSTSWIERQKYNLIFVPVVVIHLQHGGSQEGFDMNVIPAWRKGYSGKGIVVSILDDGIQTNHPDLAQNYVSFPNLYYYSCCCSIFKNKVELSSLKKQNKKSKQDPLASSDINDNDNDPMPRDNGDNKHGTRCAGEVAAVAFNSYCGVGIAFNASIGGTGTYLYYYI